MWAQVVSRAAAAQRCGALQPIETEQRIIEDAGVRFVVRVRANLRHKRTQPASPTPKPSDTDAAKERGAPANPFLPPDQELFVAELSPTHRCVLNKYNVIDHHVLVVTRQFEPQESLLTEADFEALWRLLAERPGLGFYNAGPEAGASQPHKHLQMIPLPLADAGPTVPITALFDRAEGGGGSEPVRLPRLPFAHAFARLDVGAPDGGYAAAARLHAAYARLLGAIGVRGVEDGTRLRQSRPYNLLMTRQWMLLVAREKESAAGISVNALGFAGSLFVGDRADVKTIERLGPMSLLEAVSLPAGAR